MMKKITRTTLLAIAVIVIVTAATPAHAQPTVRTRTDRAAYAPGESGTFFLTVVNPSSTDTLEIRNITIYYPWAGYVENKWQGNESKNLSPADVLTTSSGGGNVKTYSYSFSIPGWFQGFGVSGSCGGGGPFGGDTSKRYDIRNGCIVLGTNRPTTAYHLETFGITTALPTYEPSILGSLVYPIVTIVVLIVAVAFLAMVWRSLQRMEMKKPAAATT